MIYHFVFFAKIAYFTSIISKLIYIKIALFRLYAEFGAFVIGVLGFFATIRASSILEAVSYSK